jgi:hypothetical protein
VVVAYSACVAQEKFNSGIRLHRLMAWAHAYGNGPQAGIPPTQAWAEQFGLTWPKDIGDLLRAGSDVVELTAEVRGIVESLDGKENVDMLLRRFGEVEKVMENWAKVAAVPNMQTFIAPLSEAGLESLEYIGDTMGRYILERELGEDTLTRLRSTADETITLVTEADDLDDDLRIWLLDRLHEILKQLDLYKVSGIGALERVMNETVGGLGRRQGWLAQLGSSKVAAGVAYLLMLIDVTLQSTAAIQALTTAPAPSPAVTVIVQQVAPEILTRSPGPPLPGADVVEAEVIESVDGSA